MPPHQTASDATSGQLVGFSSGGVLWLRLVEVGFSSGGVLWLRLVEVVGLFMCCAIAAEVDDLAVAAYDLAVDDLAAAATFTSACGRSIFVVE